MCPRQRSSLALASRMSAGVVAVIIAAIGGVPMLGVTAGHRGRMFMRRPMLRTATAGIRGAIGAGGAVGGGAGGGKRPTGASVLTSDHARAFGAGMIVLKAPHAGIFC